MPRMYSTQYITMFANSVFICVSISLLFKHAEGLRCDRRPYGSNSQPSPPDGRFKLKVSGSDNTYIPQQLYTVQIISTDKSSHFTSFMISAEGDVKADPRNPRRLNTQYPGDLRPLDTLTAKFSDRCLYSVEQATNGLKSSVEVYWQAPPAGNGCVTLRAMVAENEEVWFEDGSPLSLKICEDLRQPDDVTPQPNYSCQICEEAKYELQFTGIWSRNTHPRYYPENDWMPKYSDLVGASHTSDFVLWSPGILATPGLKDLAEHANTTKMEAEIREKVGDGIRTMLKGKGHGYRKMRNPTYAFFRADKDHHLISTAIALHPSPDWFLGVTRFELCQEDNTWLREKELKLYPWDAGTDSGVSYESSNIETFPQDAVTRVKMSSYDRNSPFYETDIKDLHPFGKIRLTLVKTYPRKCEAPSEEDGSTGGEGDNNEPSVPEPEEPSRYQNPDIPSGESPLEPDPESTEDCPLSQWQEWSPCEGECVDGHLNGIRLRERYHLVDGVPVGKYDPNIRGPKKEVTQYCKDNFEVIESEDCEEPCSNNNMDVTASRRMNTPVAPGHPWKSSKREMPTLED